MPQFDPSALARGREALEASERSGSRKAFLPNIYWKNNGDMRYLLFLNTIGEGPESIPKVLMHNYVETDDGFPEMLMARTEGSIGERTDPLQERWGYEPARTCLAIAVELEPVMSTVKGRERPTGFEVATRTFDRRVRDEEGNPIDDEYEEVTVPKIGLVAQKYANFFSLLAAYDQNEAPLHETPLKITRVQNDNNVAYQVQGYDQAELDLTNLLEYIEDFSYIQDMDELLEAMAEADDQIQAAIRIGEHVLMQRLVELADEDNYNNVLSQVSKPWRWAKKNNRENRTQKRENSSSPRRARSREEHEEVTKAAPINKKLQALREKSKKSGDE